MSRQALKNIPKVDKFLSDEKLISILGDRPKILLTTAVRYVLEEKRKEIIDGKHVNLSYSFLREEIAAKLRELTKPYLRKVINATGVIIHTNLGRAPISREIIDYLKWIITGYSNLEYDVGKGRRGLRYRNVEDIIKILTDAEDVCVVNNNAGAVLLVLSALASGKEVIVSRGELIEIGGSFRIPDVMRQSGAILREVGTTNKTHLEDYEKAITEKTALIMKVHTSNYKILGFTESPLLKDIISLSRKHHIPVYEDLGSGCFINISRFGVTHEPTVQEVLKTDVDIASFSGDKLLGASQAGIILGKKKLLEKVKKHPLNRALRIDKMTLAVLEATLRLYLDEKEAVEKIPVLRLLFQPETEIRRKARKLSRKLKNLSKYIDVQIVKEESEVGGGALPLQKLPTYAVAIKHRWYDVKTFDCLLRNLQVPIVARIKNDKIILDMRTVDDEEINMIYTMLYKKLIQEAEDEN